MIDNCRSCKSSRLVYIISLGDQYLSDFLDGDDKPAKYPLDLILCQDCNLLQLGESIPPDSLYTERYGYRSGINQTMRDHLEEICVSAERLTGFNQGDIVIDIGCNDGTLLKSYKEHGLVRLGFDPVSKFGSEFQGTDIKYINEYFGRKKYREIIGDKKARLITAISMFYDLEDPNVFVSDLADIVSKQGIIIIQQNYLVEMLRENAFDNIVHEHLEYYSLRSLEPLLERHGLIVFDVSINNVNGGSFRTYICHKGARPVSDSVFVMRKTEATMGLDNQKVYHDFAARIANIKRELSELIEREVSQGKVIYAYGASTRGNSLLQYCKLGKNLISRAVERNPEKWGKKIASTGIRIISEEEGRNDMPDYMLVLPWFFKDEFMLRERQYLIRGGKLIFPLPRVEIVDKNSL